VSTVRDSPARAPAPAHQDGAAKSRGEADVRAQRRFARFAWGSLVWLVLVVLWGAYVRATGSGAGCGAHWPLCNGEVVPRSPSAETLVEYSHRLTSGLLLLAMVGLVVGARRVYPPRHRVRRAAVVSLVLAIVEALIGAGLVLFELVAGDQSMARGYSMAAHLVNTFLFMAAVALTAWWGSGQPPLRPGRWPRVAGIAAVGLGALLLVGMTGAIAALGDTLFPARSLGEGLRQDLDPTAHVFLRLRMAHPVVAVSAAAWLLMAAWLVERLRDEPRVRIAGRALSGLVLAQVVIGFLNLFLLAPVAMQLVHLLVADLVWLATLFWAATALAEPSRVEGEMQVQAEA